MLMLRWILPICLGALTGWFCAESGRAAKVQQSKSAVFKEVAKADLMQAADGAGQDGKMGETNVADAAFATAEIIMSQAAEAGVSSLPDLWAQAEKLPYKSPEKALAESAILKRWAEIAPLDGIAWFAALPAHDGDRGSDLVAAWMRLAPAAACAWLSDQPAEQYDISFLMTQEATDAELRSFTEFWIGLHPERLENFGTERCLARLAAADPNWASKFYGNFSGTESSQSKLAAALAQGLARTAPAQAWAWAQGLPPSAARDAALVSTLRWTAIQDFHLTQAWLQDVKLPDAALAEARYLVATGLQKESPQAALEFTRSLPDGALREVHIGGVGFQLGEDANLTDVYAMFQDFERTGASIRCQATNGNVIDSLQQVAALPDDAIRELIVNSLAASMVLSSSYHDVQTLANLPESIRGTLASGLIAIAIHNDDRALAMEYFEMIPAAKQGDFHWLNGGFSSSDGSLELAQQMIDRMAPEQRGPAQARVAEVWALHDPNAAAAWVARLPENDQPAAFQGIVQSYAWNDEVAATQWVESMPNGPLRDAAISGLIPSLIQSDLSAAVAWIQDIRSVPEREKQLTSLAKTLTKDDPEMIAQVLQGNLLAPENRAAFVQELEGTTR
jgi:hypothetical protein